MLQKLGKSERAKRLKEDSLLLIRGFDSIAHTLSQLSNNLEGALQVQFQLYTFLLILLNDLTGSFCLACDSLSYALLQLLAYSLKMTFTLAFASLNMSYWRRLDHILTY